MKNSLEKVKYAKVLNQKCYGFTLAEVLITLGILGVVMAMTLPALIGNYNKKVWATAFQKSVNTILNTHKQLFANEEQFSLCSLEDFECNSQQNLEGISVINGRMDIYMQKLGLKKMKMDLGVMTKSDLIPEEVYAAKDGSCYYPMDLFTETNNSGGPTYEMFVDVNCSKSPNKGGRDQFFVVVNEKLSLVLDVLENDQEIADTCKSMANQSEPSPYGAIYCGSYLIKNSYKMDY